MRQASLEQVLSAYGALSSTEIEQALELFELKRYQKDDILIKAGQTCDWIGFVQSGIIRNYYISSKDEEVTYCLTFPGKFITAYSSFIDATPSFENIHALGDTELLIIKKRAFEALSRSSMVWMQFALHFAQQSYVLMENRLLLLQMESAEKRYADMLAKQPEYLQEVPLKHLASYLGISQRHLSRLRKNLR